jgi:hypothetical protein
MRFSSINHRVIKTNNNKTLFNKSIHFIIDILLLPITAIQQQNGKNYVVPLRDETMKKSADTGKTRSQSMQLIQVKTGISNEEYIEILSGLKVRGYRNNSQQFGHCSSCT